MVMTKQNIKVLCAKHKDQLHVSVVDSITLKTLVEHDVERIVWDDGDVSTTFFPKDDTLPEFIFKFNKKGKILIKFFHEQEISFEIT